MRLRSLITLLLTVGFIGGIALTAQNTKNTSRDKVQRYYRSIPNAKPKNRELAFYEQRTYPFSRIPSNGLRNAIGQEKVMLGKNGGSTILAEQPQWENIGPFRVGGRVRTVIIDPKDGNNIFIGAAAGGVWRSRDQGASWEPVFDFENSLSFGALAMDPDDSNVLYAGTGEMSTNVDAYFGNGIYKTTDAGDSWLPVGLTNVGAFSRLVVHPRNSNIVYAGATKNGAGFYKSTDAGKTWEKKYDGAVSDISTNPGNENDFFIGVTGDQIYHTSDGGESWAVRDFLNGLPANSIGRISIQQAPSNPRIVYALMQVDTSVQDRTGSFVDLDHAEIFKSTDNGETWGQVYKDPYRQPVNAAWHFPFFREQGWYDQYIVIHPNNPDIVVAGGIDVWRSENGSRFNNISDWYGAGPRHGGERVHADQHAGAFDPQNPDVYFAANDGGMYISRDAGKSYRAVNNGLSITQFYGIDVDQTSPDRTYGGTQDNANRGSLAANDWTDLGGGDGGKVAVDKLNPNIVYGQDLASGFLMRIDISSGQVAWIRTGTEGSDRGFWTCPIAIDPIETDIIYHGRRTLYISFDKGNRWEPMSEDFPEFRENVDITAIGISKLNSEVIYVGTQIGDVVASRDLGTSWETVNNNGLVNRFVTDIETSYREEGTAFVTFSGFGSGHVFKTTDYGASWKDVSGVLPDVPTNSIVIHPDNEDIMFVGTDIGVYATYDGAETWFPYGVGLPRSPVVEVVIHEGSNRLRAGTHGRSVWEVAIVDVVEDYAITSPAGGELYTPSSRQIMSWYGFKGNVRVEFSSDNGNNWNTIEESAGGTSRSWAIPNVLTITARLRLTSVEDPSQVRISNTFSISQLSTGSVLKRESVGHVPYGVAYDGAGGLWTTSFYGKRVYKLNSETLTIERFFEMPEGDSLFTDLTIDKSTSTMYVHRMNSTAGEGGQIYILDMDGNMIDKFVSRAKQYPIGLAWVGEGRIAIGDRNTRDLYLYDVANRTEITRVKNPFTENFGPRGLCFDPESETFFQASTDFTGSTLQSAYNIRFDLASFGVETGRYELLNRTGTINCRGIEFDERDKTFWISDFGGNIYKIAGFDLSDLNNITDVSDDAVAEFGEQLIKAAPIHPNPVSDFASLSFELRSTADITVEVYNTAGHRVHALPIGNLPAGDHAVRMNVSMLPSGVYSLAYRVAGVTVSTHKMVVMK